MNDLNQDNNLNKDAPETDDELESLSQDEKAAFEKIMAEISAANGGDTLGGGGTDPVQSDPIEPLEDSDDDALSEPQQVSLDQVMAEVASKRKGDSQRLVNDVPQDAAEDDEAEMSDDQQMALDKIMAEIETKRKGDKQDDSEIDTEDQDQEMSDDQQAALDKIMAEIETKRKGDKQDDSEIDTEDQDQEMSDDQQAALDKIMAEIETKKSRDDVSLSEPAADEAPDTDTPQAPEPENDNLTMEEFDDELSQLLSTAQTAAPPLSSEKEKVAGKIAATGSSVNKRLENKIADLQTVLNKESQSKKDVASVEASVETSVDEINASSNTSTPISEFAILHEVQAEDSPGVRKTKKSGGDTRRFWTKKTWIGLAVALNLVLLSAIGYIGYNHRFDNNRQIDSAVPPSAAIPTQPSTAQVAVIPAASESREGSSVPPISAPVEWATARNVSTEGPSFAALQAELSSTRNDIQIRISDIQQLKSYYARGIAEEIEKIENTMENDKIPSFNQAMANPRIELALRAIQRRGIYISKLDTPLAQLTSMSEELLYMERRAGIFQILNQGINGLPAESFSLEANAAMDAFHKYNTQLSIDQVDVEPTPMADIWGSVSSEISKKVNLLAQRTPLNRAIGTEICKGNYSRNYMLTALSPETAACLINWNGKDLYLNALTELPPETAGILAQWPGEWLSLNGVKALSADTARQLAQWPGKRLSLNGLTVLSPEATRHLSQWQGAQLEMVGLLSIGRWENYGTRLYLSEKLRQQLEAQ